jgi:hypothetical protein
MDAMGYSGLFFVLAFLGQEKIGSASTLSSFPLKIVCRGQSEQRREAEQCWQQLRVTHPAAPVGCVGGHPGGQ